MKLIEHYLDLIQHKYLIFVEVIKICYILFIRALTHDLSKFGLLESKGYSQVVGLARKYKYNSKEYNKLMSKINPYLLEHYKKNDHHPQGRKINNMGIYALIEMVCDWKAATKRSRIRNIDDSFIQNKKKFNINKQLYRLLKTI